MKTLQTGKYACRLSIPLLEQSHQYRVDVSADIAMSWSHWALWPRWHLTYKIRLGKSAADFHRTLPNGYGLFLWLADKAVS